MKAGIGPGTRYGWRGALVFPGDFFDVPAGAIAGTAALNLSLTGVLADATAPTLAIFGHDADDGSANDASADKFWGSRFTKSAGAVTAINGRFTSNASGGEQFTVLCYSDSAGAPDSLLWQSGFTTLAAFPSVLGFSLPGDVSGSDAAGTYWLFIAERSTYTGQYFYASESGGSMVVRTG